MRRHPAWDGGPKQTEKGVAMSGYVYDDALTGSRVTCGYPELSAWVEPPRKPEGDAVPVKSLYFPGCSFINYSLPLVQAVYDLLKGAGRVDGVSLVCCGKILQYEPNGKEVRAAHEAQLREHILDAGVERIITACPNCVKALRALLAADERTAGVEVVPLPVELADMGYRIDAEVARKMVAAAVPDSEAASGGLPHFAPHDSCPDRDTGEFADGVRALLPEETIREAEHNRRRSFCCGSLLRAAGKPERASEQSRKHGEEAVAAKADAIVTACMSCTFLLSKEQHDVPVLHYLELLYDWRIDWESTPPYMTLRFLFDEPAPSEESRRTFVGLDSGSAE